MFNEIAIIGAGISGLLVAHNLQAEGHKVIILEKSKGVGGRMATRRDGSTSFDHGAQFFTARDPAFLEWTNRWQTEHSIAPWFTSGEQGNSIHYAGTPSMTAPAKSLAANLDVRKSTNISAIKKTSGGWELLIEEGKSLFAKTVLSTVPVPQTLELLKKGETTLPEKDLTALQQVQYAPCLAIMASLEATSDIPKPGYMKIEDSQIISSISDNQQKKVSQTPALTIHTTPDFSMRHWFTPDPERIPMVVEELAKYVTTPVFEATCHAWRYSMVQQAYPELFYHNGEGLFMCGDGFSGPRVECAAISGLAVSSVLCNYLKINRV